MKQIEHTDPLIEKAKEAKKSLAGAQSKIATVIGASNDMALVMNDSARDLANLSEEFGDNILVAIVTFPNGQRQRDVMSVRSCLTKIASRLRNAAI